MPVKQMFNGNFPRNSLRTHPSDSRKHINVENGIYKTNSISISNVFETKKKESPLHMRLCQCVNVLLSIQERRSVEIFHLLIHCNWILFVQSPFSSSDCFSFVFCVSFCCMQNWLERFSCIVDDTHWICLGEYIWLRLRPGANGVFDGESYWEGWTNDISLSFNNGFSYRLSANNFISWWNFHPLNQVFAVRQSEGQRKRREREREK